MTLRSTSLSVHGSILLGFGVSLVSSVNQQERLAISLDPFSSVSVRQLKLSRNVSKAHEPHSGLLSGREMRHYDQKGNSIFSRRGLR